MKKKKLSLPTTYSLGLLTSYHIFALKKSNFIYHFSEAKVA